MIRIGDNSYRNLEEQVLKNKQDIAEHYNRDRVLADFGITIVGYARTASELPNPISYQGEYGDGYYVGDDAPYNFYIYTRPDPNAGYNTNYWLNVGPLSIAGPAGSPGPRGEIGPMGSRGSIWVSTVDTLPSPNNYNVNDQVLRTIDGNVYELALDSDENKYWKLNGNIQGPLGVLGIQGIQGIQGILGIRGEKGEKGDVGGFINIYGILPSSTQLPQPSTLNNLTVAYLIGNTTPYDLYIQVGSTSDTAVWTNAGPFNAATLVSVNGVYLNVWDSDIKADVSYVDTNYQPKLTAGTGVTISGNTISAEGKTYTAGSGISISADGVISNTRTSSPAPKYYMHNVRAQDATNGVVLFASIINKSSTELTGTTLEAEIAKYTKSSSIYKMPLSGIVTKSSSNTTYGLILSGYSRNNGEINVEVLETFPATLTTLIHEYTITSSDWGLVRDSVVAIS